MKTKYNCLIILLFIGFSACKKEKEAGMQLAAINVVNTSLDLPSIKINPSTKAIYWRLITDQVNYGSNRFYYAPQGMATFKGVAGTDTTNLLLNSNFSLTGKIYTLYLLGNATAVEPMLVEESNFPYIRMDQPKAPSTDSVTNVRFVNLSANSPILKINIQGSSSNEFSNLSYKTISNWKAYPNKIASGTNYVFEVRNASTNDLLLTYSFSANSNNLFRGLALVIKGNFSTSSGTNAFSISPINYF